MPAASWSARLLDATVVEEAVESLPVVQAVADCLGEDRALRDDGELLLEPTFQPVDEGPRWLLADGAALIGALAADLVLDRIKRRDVS
jgi:hypothetical protein